MGVSPTDFITGRLGKKRVFEHFLVVTDNVLPKVFSRWHWWFISVTFVNDIDWSQA